MIDKEKLRKLISIIENLIKSKGNEWLVGEILKTIGKTSSLDEIAKHSVIQNIHEYCVEEIIDKQANEFYKSFPLTDIKLNLIQDYKKMEHERRRDDFEGFCLSMFQQIEAIVHFLFKSDFITSKLKDERDSPAFVEWDDSKKKWYRKSIQRLIPFLLIKVNRNRNPNFNEYQPKSIVPFYDMDVKSENEYFDENGSPIINFNPNKKGSWGFLNRFRTILFYYYFKSELREMEFDKIYKPGYYLYTCRNKIHRETKGTEKQKEILDEISGKEGKYYFIFYGFLENFISKIEQFLLTTNNNNNNKSTHSNHENKSSNTLGDNPEIEKVLKRIKFNE